MVARQTHPQSPDASDVEALHNELAKSLLELEKLRDRIATLESEGRRFLAEAAHSIRNPLTVVHSYLEILHTDLGEGLSEEQESFLAIAHANAVKLRNLVDDLVELAALETGAAQIDLAPVIFGDMAVSVVSNLRPIARRKGVELTADVAEEIPTVTVDHELLRDVVRRILDNAIRYTPKGGSVWLEARSEPDHLVVEIRDNGPGIPADRIAEAFRPFIQLHRVSGDNREGYGLGLPLSRCAVETFGGTLDLASVEGEGTTVTIKIPATRR